MKGNPAKGKKNVREREKKRLEYLFVDRKDREKIEINLSPTNNVSKSICGWQLR